MNIYPYVYRIDHPSGEFYIGYRYANTVPAEQDFGVIYKTSSNNLSHPFEEYTQTILAEFYLPSGKDDAYDFEQLTIFESWGDPNLANIRCTHGKSRWSTSGRKQSEEARAKISAARLGKTRKPFSDETKRKLSEAHSGKKLSAEHRAKISATMRNVRGKNHSGSIFT